MRWILLIVFLTGETSTESFKSKEACLARSQQIMFFNKEVRNISLVNCRPIRLNVTDY
jgi:hypothetical protein